MLKSQTKPVGALCFDTGRLSLFLIWTWKNNEVNVEDGTTVSSGFSEYDFSWCVDIILCNISCGIK